ncbi:MAG: DUF58 domain-containing protein [Pseudomonadales bacterium]|nr:DUF58 domain-containing protein [Pseudomonadales bacterium]
MRWRRPRLPDRLQKGYDRWLARRFPPLSRLRLGHRQLFIVPSLSGGLFMLLLAAMLLAAINYQNSLAFALSFWLLGLMPIALIHAYRNLLGLELTALGSTAGFVGGHGQLRLQLRAERPLRHAIELRLGGGEWVSDADSEERSITLTLPLASRGWQAIPRLEVRSGFPLGLFRVWSYPCLDWKLLAYPHPFAADARPPVSGESSAALPHGVQSGDEDFAGLDPWRLGDGWGRVAWKQWARRGELLVKRLEQPEQGAQWLDFDHCPDRSIEARLSRLAGWVLQREAEGVPYGLRLPNATLPPAVGAQQQREALTLLALYRHSS